ncbi:hypothetical protein MTR_5g010540 [Medicago truncatula]|uniref:Uncharacterized protein n=1 Tax=Medicago truncatula TaxID=3880 RepID=A0A072UCD9_MEDTR|nr:hypothetical protein MTR_5g010540 [Medicago truncatula]
MENCKTAGRTKIGIGSGLNKLKGRLEDGGDSFYGYGFSKACTGMSRSSRKDGRREI